MNKMKTVNAGGLKISNEMPFTLLAGPCQLESLDHARMMCERIAQACSTTNTPFIFKSRYDKATRTSVDSERGLGMGKGLEILAAIKEEFGVPVLTDVHEISHCAKVAEVVDVLQIPAFLSRQTDLLLAAGETGKCLNVKKGQFLAPGDMANVAAKIASTGNENIMLCDRGTSFGYNMLVSDFRCIPIMAETGYPIVFDATHSVQMPSAQGNTSGGKREFVPPLATAAAAIGVAAIFIETHQDPDNAPCDGPNMVPVQELQALIEKLSAHDRLAKV
jgi:2-dehydro-3-deoxyphosphooctonate aldolase (KDO 8-P synthase)